MYKSTPSVFERKKSTNKVFQPILPASDLPLQAFFSLKLKTVVQQWGDKQLTINRLFYLFTDNSIHSNSKILIIRIED
jgi:hypothetical protein